MPDVTNIETTYTRKVQLEQFEPVSHTVTLSAELGSDESPEQAYDELSERVEEMVERAISARVAAKKLDSDDSDEDD